MTAKFAQCWICDSWHHLRDLEFATEYCRCVLEAECEHGLCPSCVEALICVLVEEAHPTSR